MVGRAGFDRLGDVNSEIAQAQLGTRRTAAADGFSDLEMPDGCADAATDVNSHGSNWVWASPGTGTIINTRLIERVHARALVMLASWASDGRRARADGRIRATERRPLQAKIS